MIVKLLKELHHTYDDHSIQYMGDDLIQVKACKYNIWYSILITIRFLNDAENAIDYIMESIQKETDSLKEIYQL